MGNKGVWRKAHDEKNNESTSTANTMHFMRAQTNTFWCLICLEHYGE